MSIRLGEDNNATLVIRNIVVWVFVGSSLSSINDQEFTHYQLLFSFCTLMHGHIDLGYGPWPKQRVAMHNVDHTMHQSSCGGSRGRDG